jgi:hypothetical protein
MADIAGSLGQQIAEVAIAAPGGAGATQVSGANTGAASAITATLTGAAGKFTHLTGYTISGLGATGASLITVTITGCAGGTQTTYYAVSAGATLANPPLVVTGLNIVSSAVNTNIVVNVPSFGAGNTAAGVNATGYLL